MSAEHFSDEYFENGDDLHTFFIHPNGVFWIPLFIPGIENPDDIGGMELIVRCKLAFETVAALGIDGGMLVWDDGCQVIAE